jgi:hypothetical protein
MRLRRARLPQIRIRHALRLDEGKAVWHRRLGQTLLAIGHQEGGHSLELLDRSNRAFRRAIDIDPDFAPARKYLIRTEIRRENWPAASQAAWYPSPKLTDSSHSRNRVAIPALRAQLELPSQDHDEELLHELATRPAEYVGCAPLEWWFPSSGPAGSDGTSVPAERDLAHPPGGNPRGAVWQAR